MGKKLDSNNNETIEVSSDWCESLKDFFEKLVRKYNDNNRQVKVTWSYEWRTFSIDENQLTEVADLMMKNKDLINQTEYTKYEIENILPKKIDWVLYDNLFSLNQQSDKYILAQILLKELKYRYFKEITDKDWNTILLSPNKTFILITPDREVWISQNSNSIHLNIEWKNNLNTTIEDIINADPKDIYVNIEYLRWVE